MTSKERKRARFLQHGTNGASSEDDMDNVGVKGEPMARAVKEEPVPTRIAITATAAELLEVVLDRSGVLPVNDESDVTDVDSHSERACADDRLQRRFSSARELSQEVLSLVRRQLAVVEGKRAPGVRHRFLHLAANVGGRYEYERAALDQAVD